MELMKLLEEGRKAVAEALRTNNAQRGEWDKLHRENSKCHIIHASELGECPHLLWGKWAGKVERHNLPLDTELFLADGLWHEQRTGAYLTSGVSVVLHEYSEPEHYVGHNIPSMSMDFPLEENEKAIGVDFLRLIGTPDFTLTGPYPKEILEHKAIKSDTFNRYKESPQLIPHKYRVQLAAYIHGLGAERGVLVFRNRDSGEYFPEGDTSFPVTCFIEAAEAARIVGEQIQVVKDVLRGEVDKYPRTYKDDCRFCPLQRACFGGLSEEGKKDLVEIPTEDDTIFPAINRLREAKKMMKIAEAIKSTYDPIVKSFLKLKGLRGVKGSCWTVSLVTRKGSQKLTPESKEQVDMWIEDGTLTTQQGESTEYIDVRDKEKGE